MQLRPLGVRQTSDPFDDGKQAADRMRPFRQSMGFHRQRVGRRRFDGFTQRRRVVKELGQRREFRSIASTQAQGTIEHVNRMTT